MKQIDFSKLKVGSISSRKSKVGRQQLMVGLKSKGVSAFVDSLPDILRAHDLKALTATMIAANRNDKPILWMFGAHVIKVGLAPVMCEIMRKGFAQQIATNNAGLIHDLELSFFGSTSEDVEAAITDGQFGMTRETGELYSAILTLADERKIGLGEAAGILINSFKAKYRNASVFATAQRLQVPATVHVAIGTDIVNAHSGYDGAKAGAASQIDFRIFCENVRLLKNGGIAMNFGSAVIMPEVFLKALAIARNLDHKFSKFTTANFDMISLYRPHNNLIMRPRLLGATAYEFAGHHEIMLPLLWAVVRDRLKLR